MANTLSQQDILSLLLQYLQIPETSLQDDDWYAGDVADDLRRQVFPFLERVCDYIKAL